MDLFSRSKTYTQVSSASSTPPLSSRSGAAVGPPMAPQQQQKQHTVKNILKNVECHVRIMSSAERTTTSSNGTALRLRLPDGDSAGSNDTNGGGGGGLASPASQDLQNTQSSGGTSGWSQPFNVTRVHRSGTTARFYEEVVAPCVSNCTSGQSYVFLVNGAPESGRSQTLYGSPHHSEQGIVELAAADLLQRMASRGKVIMRNHRDRPGPGEREDGLAPTAAQPPSSSPSAAVPAACSAPQGGDGGGADAAELPMTGGITVTYSAFTTRGTKMAETETGDSVPLVEFPPPLGLVPLPRMRLLEDASKAVLLPERKHVDTSCVIQFQVYAPVDTTGRRSMATLTFLDVAAIREPLCKEVAHLIDTVEKVAGVSTTGGDPNFKETKLTTLLEPALVGYITLVSVTTISGRADLYESTSAALRFASNLSRIHQVLMLIHMNAPRWIFDTAVHLEHLRTRRDQLMAEHYARGVYDYYVRVSQWLRANASDVGGNVERLLLETAQLRTTIARAVEDMSGDLQHTIKGEDATCRDEVEAARSAYEATSRLLEEVRQLDERITAQQLKMSQTDMQSSQHIGEMRLEISALEAKAHNLQQQLQQLEKEMKLYILKTNEVAATLGKSGEEMQFTQSNYAMSFELVQLGQKRKRLEEDLELAARVAQRTTDTMRADLGRRSRIARLRAMQQRVNALQETSSAALSTTPATSS